MSKLQQVNSFCDDRRSGNSHQVSLIETFNELDIANKLSMHVSPSIYVEISLQKYPNKVDLRFYHKGREVLNCGSGTLAAAHYLRENKIFSYSQLLELTLRSKTKESRIVIHAGKLGLTQMVCPAFKIAPLNRQFWVNLLGAAPTTLATLGTGQTYFLTEFASTNTVRDLKPNFNKLAKFTHRALIVTAKADPSMKEDYVMRYFAPRFGNPEDTATGSANFLLMQYWWKSWRDSWLQGVQLSPGGGSFLGRINEKHIELYGETK